MSNPTYGIPHLDQGLALIRAFMEAAAKDQGFTNIETKQIITPYIPVTSPHERVDQCLSFQSPDIETEYDIPALFESLIGLEHTLTGAFGSVHKVLTAADEENDHQYIVQMDRVTAMHAVAAIKRQLRSKIEIDPENPQPPTQQQYLGALRR